MKTLLIVRHARAEKATSDKTDDRRVITRRGEIESRRIVRKIKKQLPKPLLLITSPARRALQTARIFAREMDIRVKKIRIEPQLYDSLNARQFIEMVAATDPAVATVILFGHNPSLTDLARLLLDDFSAEIQKSGAVALQLQSDQWNELLTAPRQMLFYDYPPSDASAAPITDLDPETEMAQRLYSHLHDFFEQIQPDAANHLDEWIIRYSKKLARRYFKLPPRSH